MKQLNPLNKIQTDGTSLATPTAGVFIALIVTLAVALGSGALFVWGVAVPGAASVVIGTVVLAALWIASLALSRKLESTINWLHPMFGLGAWYLTNFGFGAIYAYFDPYSAVRVPPLTPLLATGVWAAVLGYSLLLLGFFVAALWKPVSLPAVLRPTWFSAAIANPQTRLLLLFVCLALGWPNRIYMLLSGRFAFGMASTVPNTSDGAFMATFGMLEYFLPIAIMFAAINALKARNAPSYILFAVVLLLDMAWGFITGSKSQAFMPLVWAYATCYGLLHQQWKWRSWLYLGGLALLFLFLFPLFNAYRTTPGRETNPFRAWLVVLTQQFSSDYDVVGSSVGASAARIGGVVPLALVVAYTPGSWDFQYGGTFVSSFFSPIPRFIWTSKPRPFDKVNFGRSYYLQAPTDYGTSQTPTVPGELYLNFGWWGIIFGMFLYGVIVRLIWSWFQVSARGAGELLILLLFWSSLLITSGLLSDYIGIVPRSLAIALLIFWLVARLAGRLRFAQQQQGSLQARGGL